LLSECGGEMTSASNIVMRLAARHDLKEIVQLLLDDTLAGVHELPGDSAAGGLSESYLCAWRQIEASDENEILVAIDPPQVIAVLQLTFIPSLTLRGSRRAQIEGVRVASPYRGHGVGTRLVEWALQLAKAKNCRLVQLTMDRRRERASRFYQRLGFVATHEGFKMKLDP